MDQVICFTVRQLLGVAGALILGYVLGRVVAQLPRR